MSSKEIYDRELKNKIKNRTRREEIQNTYGPLNYGLFSCAFCFIFIENPQILAKEVSALFFLGTLELGSKNLALSVEAFEPLKFEP